MHQVVAQTIHLSIGYSRQTDGGFSRQKKMGRASNLSQDIFSYCLTILHTHDSGMPIRSIPPFPFWYLSLFTLPLLPIMYCFNR